MPRLSDCLTPTENGCPRSAICKDVLGREVRRVTWSFQDQLSYVDTHYEDASRPVEVSHPYRPAAPGQQAPTVYYTRTVHDEFGRVEFVRFPDGSLQTVEYGLQGQPLLTRTTNAKGQKSDVLRNVLGETIAETVAFGTVDAATTTHQYDALGRLKWTDGPMSGTVDRIEIGYDIVGHKTQVSDPDKGVWRYHYNGFGELLCQVDAKGQGSFNTYDSLGRLTGRSERSGVTDPASCTGTTLGTSSWTFSNEEQTGRFGQLTAESYQYTDPTVGAHLSRDNGDSHDFWRALVQASRRPYGRAVLRHFPDRNQHAEAHAAPELAWTVAQSAFATGLLA